MFDIITFGAATQDIYFASKKMTAANGQEFATGQGVCFNLGSKVEMDDVFFSSGGGGTNAAATFAKQGLKTAYFGQIGQDCFGNLILDDLKDLKINTSLIRKTTEKPTNTSVILAMPGKDRTILVYRGASDFLEKKDIPWDKIKNTKWFYLAPFSGKLADLTGELVSFAKENNIKVAINPGYKQLSLPESELLNIFKKVDILFLNQEEASLVTKITYQQEKEVFKKLDEMVSGICVMTKGREGSMASDGQKLYAAEALPAEEIDLTGGGDSFAAGFVTGFLKNNDIVFALQLGAANSSANIGQMGAKKGLLNKGQDFARVSVKVLT
jgi:sugar/nucleoside kinase (ribokinase family)